MHCKYDHFAVDPDGWYRTGWLFDTLGIVEEQLMAARKEGRLRFTKIGNCTFYQGAWIIAWLRGDDHAV